MAFKKWTVRDADKEKASAISEKFNIDPFVAFLLVSRGFDDDVSVSGFLSDSFETVSPFNFADMEEASFVIGDAIDTGEKICIYGDYDCDGVTATALLLTFLRSEGADVFYYIPDRLSEGYGINKDAVDRIKEKGANLIVTVDNGISSVEEAEYIYSLGMRLVVTDHHQLGETLPRAEAVVNPYREENELEFRDYCGVGVAFKLVQAMYEGNTEDLIERYIDLVAIGTIADVMPLIYENRSFVREGLKRINSNPRPALEAVRSMSDTDNFTADRIAFLINPRINALGRLGDASRAVEFLISTEIEDCKYKYEQICLENTRRQEIEKEILDDVLNTINKKPTIAMDRVIVISGKNYHQGIVGIVANQIVERYSKPVFIISVGDDGIARGSARSLGGFNLHDAISACSDDLIRFGGHPLAAGVTLYENNIDSFRKHINEYALKNYPVPAVPELVIDAKISPNYLTLDLFDSLSVLEPYGASNSQATFGVYDMTLVSVTPLKEGKHVRLELEKKGRKIRVVKFRTPYDEFPYKSGDILNLAVKVFDNVFNERRYLSIHAVDIHLAGTNDDKYFTEKSVYELYRCNNTANASLYPDRDKCAAVYRYLKKNNGYRYSLDDLYFRLQNEVTYGQLMTALKAFLQAGLIKMSGGITLLPSHDKVNLEDTNVMKTLRERINLG